MASNFTLFEVSWEVCSKVGGIHTVISTKAKTLVDRFGDDYIAIGPWQLTDTGKQLPFRQEAGFDDFAGACREMGLPVRVGRWSIPGNPRTILVEFSRLYDEKDDLLAKLWEDFGVDSIAGAWDYVEPVLFGLAAGRVIERWWEEYLAPYRKRAVAQAHEWMTGSALLHLQSRIPSIGTVFTTHATMLGRALSSVGHSPEDGLGDATPAELAQTHGVVAKHSIEGTCARQADVFTTVSEITAREAELLHGRAPSPLLPNGIDLDVVDALAGPTSREAAAAKLRHLANQFLGEDLSDAALLCVSGRYEFRNKGIDLLLDALARLEGQDGRRIVLFVLVPAGNSGPRSEVLERLDQPLAELDGPCGLSTHNLFDEEHDPVHQHCAHLGIDNHRGSRIKLVQVPIYLASDDGFLGLPYEAAVRAMDLTCFPSYYEPWGYTPQESLAVGVPTITSDYAGFGRWAQGEGLDRADGVTVLERVHREYDEIVDDLAGRIESFVREGADDPGQHETCRRTAARTAWSGLIAHYDEAFRDALERVAERARQGVPQSRRPQRALKVQPAPDGRHPRLVPFDVATTLPEPLIELKRLARNYWWSWDAEGARLFEEISPSTWDECRHNPVLFLRRVAPEDLEARAADTEFLERLRRTLARFDAYLAEAGGAFPGDADAPDGARIRRDRPVAYFSAEFGIHESLPVYAGGLGVLAGDHVKSASDANLPLVAIGLYYRLGYMTQRVTTDGEQVAAEVANEPGNLPLNPVLGDDGEPLEICLQLPGSQLFLRAWQVDVGRVPLYLLDADTPSNRDEDRVITRSLYGGDQEMRLRQEIVLGRGGARLLRRLGIEPSVFHINEGHAAFLSLERVADLVGKEGLTFEQARAFVRRTTLFTTHTPVPAGHDRFGEDLVRRYFSDAPQWVGLPWERFFALGHAEAATGEFNMTYLALAFASRSNAVSRLHGEASRQLLHPVWPTALAAEVPVRSVTNGIHLSTWTSPAMRRALGASEGPVRGEQFAQAASELADTTLWNLKRANKRRLLDKVRRSLRKSFVARDDSPLLLTRMLDGLDENALLIGFARRFAPYKRAHLLFEDRERLLRLLSNRERPVRILIAGKAHPRDELGRQILKRVADIARSDDLAGRVFFVEDYGIDLARALVQGVDVWLNTPTRMQEASGTSGMKAAANGALNLSIADGWWPEANDGTNGWTIGDRRVYEDQALQDQLDATTLYRLLEEDVVPRYFRRGAQGVPAGWLERVRRSLATIPSRFNTDRMLRDYHAIAYRDLARQSFELSADKRAALKELVKEESRVRKGFADVAFVSARMADLDGLRMGDTIDVHGELELGTLAPEDVAVELVIREDASDKAREIERVPLPFAGKAAGTVHAFEGSWRLERSGRYSYGIRARARAAASLEDGLGDLVVWA